MTYFEESMRRLGRPIVRRKFPPGTTEKPCSICGQVLPLAMFSELKAGALGRQSRCKGCINKIGREYTRRKREAESTSQRPSVCDCCRLPPGRRSLHWDHDHATRQFRGWLCHGCNSALGQVGDSAERLQRLIAYLNRGGGPG